MIKNRVVMASAIISPYRDIIVIGKRHYDQEMQRQFDLLKIKKTAGWEQGFIDQHGVFMDRVEALHVAIVSGQLNGNMSKGQLYSEDIF
jgi:hypothetical protein